MSATAPARRRLLRWIALAILGLLVALAVALVVYVHHLLQPQRFTALLENELAAAGLHLTLQAPAAPILFPHPGVELKGFSLTIPGARAPVLQASGATIVVPWRALLYGEVAIERIDITGPRLSLDELGALLARLPHRAGPPRLPTIAIGIRMSQGTLTRAGTPVLFDVSLATGALAPGRPFRLDAAARTAAGRRIVAALSTVPSPARGDAIHFNPLQIAITEQQGSALQLAGHADWRGGDDLALALAGTLQHRAFGAQAPAPRTTTTPGAKPTGTPAGQNVVDRISLDIAPARAGTPLAVALKLDGNDTKADLRLQPTEFRAWWAHLFTAVPGAPLVPLPLTGTAKISHLDFGSIKATGISIEAGPDLAPASATTAARAAAASAGH